MKRGRVGGSQAGLSSTRFLLNDDISHHVQRAYILVSVASTEPAHCRRVIHSDAIGPHHDFGPIAHRARSPVVPLTKWTRRLRGPLVSGDHRRSSFIKKKASFVIDSPCDPRRRKMFHPTPKMSVACAEPGRRRRVIHSEAIGPPPGPGPFWCH